MGLQRVGHDWATFTLFRCLFYLRAFINVWMTLRFSTRKYIWLLNFKHLLIWYLQHNPGSQGEGNGTLLQYSCLENPWTEEPGRLQSMGSLGVRHYWATSLSLFTFTHWRRKWQPTPVFLPGESQGQGSLMGCHLWGPTVRHDWSDLAAAAAAATAAVL